MRICYFVGTINLPYKYREPNGSIHGRRRFYFVGLQLPEQFITRFSGNRAYVHARDTHIGENIVVNREKRYYVLRCIN